MQLKEKKSLLKKIHEIKKHRIKPINIGENVVQIGHYKFSTVTSTEGVSTYLYYIRHKNNLNKNSKNISPAIILFQYQPSKKILYINDKKIKINQYYEIVETINKYFKMNWECY